LKILTMFLLVTEMISINFILKAIYFPISALVKWILSVSLNVQTLSLKNVKRTLNSLYHEIGCLEKLKELKVMAQSSSDLKEVTIVASRIITTLLTSS
jgi:hypothetical protein